ncbi:MAG: hypothetical protein ACRETF_00755 [Nevskiaceae bacterium]
MAATLLPFAAITRRDAPRRPWNRVAQRALIVVIAGVQALALGGCAWLGLSWGAFSYPTTQSGEAANVAVYGDWAYVTRGAVGYEVLRAGRSTTSHVFMAPPGLGSVDDVAVADGLLFVLDAQPPGYLRVLSLADPSAPRLIGAPVEVPVGPFSGVTAAGGRVIVSGGTSSLTLRPYDRAGRLGPVVASADLGRGQPDALLAAGGELGFVSTHDWGPYFHVALVRASLQPPAVTEIGAVAVDSYGFTPGGARPASFPIETAVEGSLLYVASAAGLGIFDVADATAPKLLARIDPGVMPVNVDVRGGIAAVVGSKPAPLLVFVDVRDPAHPEILQSYPLPDGSLATGVALTDTYAVVAAHGHGAQLFDRSAGAWQHFTRPFPHLTPGSSQHDLS